MQVALSMLLTMQKSKNGEISFISWNERKNLLKFLVERLHLITVDYLFPLCERSVDVVSNALPERFVEVWGGPG